jgi:hypothetical protein
MRVEFDHAGVHWAAYVIYDPGAPAYRLDDPDLAEEAIPDEIEVDELWRRCSSDDDWECVDWIMTTDYAGLLIGAALRAARYAHMHLDGRHDP